VNEIRKIHEARGGGASAHPTAPKFIDLFSLSPIFIQPEINGEQTKYGRGQTVQCNAVQCSTV